MFARRLLLASTATLALVSAPSAHAVADIEGTWGFSEGQVVVAPSPTPASGFTGTIIRATRFSTCEHPVGEQMWTGLTLQPDGQYWGKHQWYNTATCARLTPLGNTAFRVLRRDDGQRFLRACFAGPEFPDQQPTIDAAGTSADTTTGCADSNLIAPPAAAPKLTDIATLPKATKKCRSKRSFRIRLKEPKGDALNGAKVYVNGKLVRTIKRSRLTAPVDLVGLPKGRYVVKINATTVLGATITGTRIYRTCVKKRTSKSNSRL